MNYISLNNLRSIQFVNKNEGFEKFMQLSEVFPTKEFVFTDEQNELFNKHPELLNYLSTCENINQLIALLPPTLSPEDRQSVLNLY